MVREWMKKYWIALTVGCAFLLTLIGIGYAVKDFDDSLHAEFVEEHKFYQETTLLKAEIVANSEAVKNMAQSIERSNNTQLYVFLNKRIAELKQTRQTRQLTHQEEMELVQLEVQLSNLKKQLGIK